MMNALTVYSLNDGKERKYNPNNYDDDFDCGFIYFSKDIINELKKYFLIFCYYMVDENGNYYLIDDLEDKIMLFEGEYNRIKFVIKNDLIKYNIKINFEKYLPISSFMRMKVFLLDWHACEKSGYFYMLAEKCQSQNLANKIGKCSLRPINYGNFCSSVRDLIYISNFPYEELDLQKDFKEIIHSAIENIFIEFSSEELGIYFEQICKVILYYLKGELKK